MERLTFVKCPKCWDTGRHPTKYTSRKTFQEVVDRLAHYEDMGLEPERIQEFMAKWVKIVELAGFMQQEGIEHLRELVKAEDEGRLVEVVKCKECVYFENRTGYTPYCAHPSCIVGDGVGEEFFCPNGERKPWLENALKGGAK